MKTDTNSWNGSNNIKSVLSFLQLCFQQSQLDILVHLDVCFTDNWYMTNKKIIFFSVFMKTIWLFLKRIPWTFVFTLKEFFLSNVNLFMFKSIYFIHSFIYLLILRYFLFALRLLWHFYFPILVIYQFKRSSCVLIYT